MSELSEVAVRFEQLDEGVKEMLRRMEPDQVEALKYVSTIPRDELRGMMKFFRDVKAVSGFFKWAVLLLFGILIGTVTFGESILKVIGWIKGSPV